MSRIRQTPSCLDFRTCYHPLRDHAIHLPSSHQGENGRRARQDVRIRFARPSDWLTASAYSLETLSVYIQSQRNLLSQTQSEIERLHALKKDVKNEEDPTVEDINQKACPSGRFLWSTLDRRAYSSPPACLDWTRKLGWMWV